MNVLIVYAHPEPKSLNGKLKELAVETLTKKGHEVKISDLHGLNFKATLDQSDFPNRSNLESFNPILEQYNAVKTGHVSEDVFHEMEKVKWADLIIFQFPIYWTSMPAILKGWIDRVFANGFAFDAAEERFYDTGLLKGKKALLSITTGAPRILYTEGMPHGDIEQLLTCITHNTLEFVGLEVLPIFGIFGPGAMDAQELENEIIKYRILLESF